MNITAAIRSCRQKHGLSQEKVAKMMGVSQPLFNAWESGKKMPSFAQVHKMSILFQTDDDLIQAFVTTAFNEITKELMEQGDVNIQQINQHRQKVIYYLSKLIEEDEEKYKTEEGQQLLSK